MRGALCILFCLLFLSFQSIWATKARIEALGGSDRAYRFYDDTTNIFVNPAYMNQVKDFMVFEWGTDREGPDLAFSKPRPEGGIVKSGEIFIFGLYLGHEEGYQNRLDADLSPKFLYQDNPVEVFIGGDAGSQWGASVKFSASHDNRSGFKKAQESLKFNFGILSGPIEGAISIDIFDRSRGGETYSESFRNDLSFKQSFNYLWNDMVFYETFERNGFKHYRPADGQLNVDQAKHQLTLGGGQTFQINEKSKCYVDLYYMITQTKKRYNLSRSDDKRDKNHVWRIPVTFGVETQTFEWLMLRASLSQNLLSNSVDNSNKSISERATTVVKAGASLTFKSLRIDGMVGRGSSENSYPYQNEGVIAPLLTEVALIYWF